MLVVALAMRAHDSCYHRSSSVETPPSVARSWSSVTDRRLTSLTTDSSNRAKWPETTLSSVERSSPSGQWLQLGWTSQKAKLSTTTPISGITGYISYFLWILPQTFYLVCDHTNVAFKSFVSQDVVQSYVSHEESLVGALVIRRQRVIFSDDPLTQFTAFWLCDGRSRDQHCMIRQYFSWLWMLVCVNESFTSS